MRTRELKVRLVEWHGETIIEITGKHPNVRVWATEATIQSDCKMTVGIELPRPGEPAPPSLPLLAVSLLVSVGVTLVMGWSLWRRRES